VGERVQLIFSENPGSLPADYQLPPGLDLVVSSVVARFNGALAAATFIPVLEVLSQDDRLMARVRPDQEFAVGDTGVVTFAPFLRRQAAAANGAADLPWARAQKTFASAVQSIPNNSNTNVVWTNYQNIGAGESGEGVFDDDPGVDQDLVPLLGGVYLVKIGLFWAVTNVGKFAYAVDKNVGLIEWYYGDTQHTTLTHTEFYATSLQHVSAPGAGGDIRWSLTLYQASGAAKNLDAAYLHAVRLGDYTGLDWFSLNPDQT
jgi:hypothetical protein